MTDTLDPLIRDLVVWCAAAPRAYADVLEAWRTSCPRLTVWEEAVDRGLLKRAFDPERGALVVITERGRALVREPAVAAQKTPR